MTISDWMMVLAVLLAPLVAVQVQKYIEVISERRLRKLSVFNTLMATRAARISPAHVQALNMIDLEFYGRKIFGIRYQKRSEKAVVEAWKAYLDHLNTQYAADELNNWMRTGDDFLTELLYTMAQSLGYHFDKVHLKRGIYSPKGHGDQEMDQLIIRQSLVKILSGNQSLPMKITSLPVSEEALKKQDELQTSLLEYLDGKRITKIEVQNLTKDLKQVEK